MAKLYRTSGEVAVVEPANGKSFTLEEMQGFVGGSIELAPAPNGKTLIVNEEGLWMGLALNGHATAISGRPIVGDALLVTISGAGTAREAFR